MTLPVYIKRNLNKTSSQTGASLYTQNALNKERSPMHKKFYVVHFPSNCPQRHPWPLLR